MRILHNFEFYYINHTTHATSSSLFVVIRINEKNTHILIACPWTIGEDEYIKIKVLLSLWTRNPYIGSDSETMDIHFHIQ